MKREEIPIEIRNVREQIYKQLMDISQQNKIKIRWDRFIITNNILTNGEKEFYFDVFGWISNKKHQRGDFIIVNYIIYKNQIESKMITSSALLSKRIEANSNLYKTHDHCIKFRELFDLGFQTRIQIIQDIEKMNKEDE